MLDLEKEKESNLEKRVKILEENFKKLKKVTNKQIIFNKEIISLKKKKKYFLNDAKNKNNENEIKKLQEKLEKSKEKEKNRLKENEELKKYNEDLKNDHNEKEKKRK